MREGSNNRPEVELPLTATPADDEAKTSPVALPFGIFRYGLDLGVCGPEAGNTLADLTESDHVQAVVLLSSLASDGELLIGAAAQAAIDQPKRLQIDDFEKSRRAGAGPDPCPA